MKREKACDIFDLVSKVRARERQRPSATPYQDGRKETKSYRGCHNADRLPQFWFGGHEQDNAKKEGGSDAERRLQERILESTEEFGVDGPRIGASPANRTHAPASQGAERRDKQNGSNRDPWPRQLEG